MTKTYYQVDLDNYTVIETTSPDENEYYSARKTPAYRYLFNRLPKEILLSDRGKEIEAEAFPAPLYYRPSQEEWIPSYRPGDYIMLKVAFLEEKESPEIYYYAVDFKNKTVRHSSTPFTEQDDDVLYATSKEIFYLKIAYSSIDDNHLKKICKIRGLSKAARMFKLPMDWEDNNNPYEFVLL